MILDDFSVRQSRKGCSIIHKLFGVQWFNIKKNDSEVENIQQLS